MGCAATTEVEALVADSAFATHRSVIDYAVRRTLHMPFAFFDWATDLVLWWRAGYRLHQVEPLRYIGRLSPRPVMIVHGLKDTVVDPRDATLLYNAAADPKELWLIPDADHCGAYFIDRITYINKVIDFFDHYLKRSRLPIQLQSHISDKATSSIQSVNRHLSEAS
jgi:fermentation-respiration switch protein FrsA (DUF1100 family)